jgi:hypothetical protein
LKREEKNRQKERKKRKEKKKLDRHTRIATMEMQIAEY